MKTTILWGLVALNAVLLAMLLGWGRPNVALAQAARGRGDYLMAPGQLTAGNTEVVFILDTRNALLTFAAQNGNQISSIAPVDLNRIFNPPAPPGGGRRP